MAVGVRRTICGPVQAVHGVRDDVVDWTTAGA
jgi:hypothetical protein